MGNRYLSVSWQFGAKGQNQPRRASIKWPRPSVRGQITNKYRSAFGSPCRAKKRTSAPLAPHIAVSLRLTGHRVLENSAPPAPLIWDQKNGARGAISLTDA